MKDLDLRGKDYFTQAEAAHYMCRSYSKFRDTVKSLKIPYFMVDGVKMFRKIEIQGAIEEERLKQWQHSANGGGPGIFAGHSRSRRTRPKNTGAPLAA